MSRPRSLLLPPTSLSSGEDLYEGASRAALAESWLEVARRAKDLGQHDLCAHACMNALRHSMAPMQMVVPMGESVFHHPPDQPAKAPPPPDQSPGALLFEALNIIPKLEDPYGEWLGAIRHNVDRDRLIAFYVAMLSHAVSHGRPEEFSDKPEQIRSKAMDNDQFAGWVAAEDKHRIRFDELLAALEVALRMLPRPAAPWPDSSPHPPSASRT